MGVALAACVAQAVSIEEVKVMEGRGAIYLRWTADSGEDADTHFSVRRNGVEIAWNVKRHEFIDNTAVPYQSYSYDIWSSKTGWSTAWGDIWLGNRTVEQPIFTIDREYEMTLDELRTSYRQLEPYSIPNSTLNKADVGGAIGWANSKMRTDEYNGDFLKWDTSKGPIPDPYKQSVEIFDNETHKISQGYETGYILDQNRYLWVEDKADDNGTVCYKNEIPNFTNTSAKAADCYPWAAHGLSWRGASGDSKNETCWYITVRDTDTGKYGVMCVWGPDRYGRQPYGGHPFFQSFKEAQDQSGWGYSWSDYVDDNTYSIAMGENGRSYTHAYYTTIGKAPAYYAVRSCRTAGNKHSWYPRVKELNGTQRSQFHGIGASAPGSRCDLWNAKGNFSEVSEGEQTYGYAWMAPLYAGGGNNTHHLKFRRNRVDETVNTSYTRFNINEIINDYQVTGPNYIIPMTGKERQDVFLQLMTGNESAHIFYIGHNRLSSTLTGAQNLGETKDVQAIDLGLDYRHIVGGCTFSLNGEKFLLLATRRVGGVVRGDFSIFKINIDDNATFGDQGQGTVSLEPVANYTTTDAKFAGNGWENVNRVFFKAYDKGDHAEIYTYLPGRALSMYNFRPSYIGASAPQVNVYPVKANMDWNYCNGHWGQEYADLKDLNTAYEHLDRFDAYVSWTAAGFNKWGDGTSDRDTEWRLDHYERTVTHVATGQQLSVGNTSDNDQGFYNDNRINSSDIKVTVRPVFKRKHYGSEETAYGNISESVGNLTYTPQPTNPDVKVYEFHTKADKDGNTTVYYRVDISFNAAYATDSKGNTINPTRYELSRSAGQYDTNTKNLLAGGRDDHDCLLLVSNHSNAKNEPLVHIGSINGNWINFPGNYDFNYWPTNALGGDRAVISFYSTDPTVKTDKYHVRAVYGDRWGETINGTNFAGIASFADAHANPSFMGYTTGIDNIDADDSNLTVEWYNTLGIKVAADNLTPGIYLRRQGKTTQKVIVK